MEHIVFWLVVAIIVITILYKLPPTSIFVELAAKSGIDGLRFAAKHGGQFLVWGAKKLAADHYNVVKHATTSRNTLDPTQKIRRATAGYDD